MKFICSFVSELGNVDSLMNNKVELRPTGWRVQMTPKEYRVKLHNEVATALVTTTDSYDKLAARFGISNKTVYEIAKSRGIKRRIGRPKKQVV